MALKKENKETKNDSGSSITIDFSKLITPDPSKLSFEVSTVQYSNHAVIQIMERDMYIDFLQLPGVKKGDKWEVTSTRIYLTHSHGQKLAKSIQEVLEKSYREHEFETVKIDK